LPAPLGNQRDRFARLHVEIDLIESTGATEPL